MLHELLFKDAATPGSSHTLRIHVVRHVAHHQHGDDTGIGHRKVYDCECTRQIENANGIAVGIVFSNKSKS
jgi:hypothetical protein